MTPFAKSVMERAGRFWKIQDQVQRQLERLMEKHPESRGDYARAAIDNLRKHRSKIVNQLRSQYKFDPVSFQWIAPPIMPSLEPCFWYTDFPLLYAPHPTATWSETDRANCVILLICYEYFDFPLSVTKNMVEEAIEQGYSEDELLEVIVFGIKECSKDAALYSQWLALYHLGNVEGAAIIKERLTA